MLTKPMVSPQSMRLRYVDPTRYSTGNEVTFRLEITEEFLGIVKPAALNANHWPQLSPMLRMSTGYWWRTRSYCQHGWCPPLCQARIIITVGTLCNIHTYGIAHDINLAIVHASREPLIRTCSRSHSRSTTLRRDCCMHYKQSFN